MDTRLFCPGGGEVLRWTVAFRFARGNIVGKRRKRKRRMGESVRMNRVEEEGGESEKGEGRITKMERKRREEGEGEG